MRDLRGCSCFFVSVSITPNPLRIRPFRVARKHAGTGETPHRLVRYALSIGGAGGYSIFHGTIGGLSQKKWGVPQTENFGLHKGPLNRAKTCVGKFFPRGAMAERGKVAAMFVLPMRAFWVTRLAKRRNKKTTEVWFGGFLCVIPPGWVSAGWVSAPAGGSSHIPAWWKAGWIAKSWRW